jgi:hypothetical protein
MSDPEKPPHPSELLGQLIGIALKALFAANGVLFALYLWGLLS